MAEDFNFETFISISPKGFGIYLFDIKKQKNLYIQELILDNNTYSIDLINLDKYIKSIEYVLLSSINS